MGLKRTDEFRKDAVRIALTSGLTRKQVAGDLGVGMSTLNKWITAHRDIDVVSNEDMSLVQENDRLRRENRILKEERDILKSHGVLARAKSRKVQVCGRTPRSVSDRALVSDHGCQPAWLAGVPQPTSKP